MESSRLRAVAIILFVVGVALLVVGVIYFTVAANNLPSFLGHLANVTKHRTRRGTASTAAGVLFLIVGAGAFYRARKPSGDHSTS